VQSGVSLVWHFARKKAEGGVPMKACRLWGGHEKSVLIRVQGLEPVLKFDLTGPKGDGKGRGKENA